MVSQRVEPRVSTEDYASESQSAEPSPTMSTTIDMSELSKRAAELSAAVGTDFWVSAPRYVRNPPVEAVVFGWGVNEDLQLALDDPKDHPVPQVIDSLLGIRLQVNPSASPLPLPSLTLRRLYSTESALILLPVPLAPHPSPRPATHCSVATRAPRPRPAPARETFTSSPPTPAGPSLGR